MTLLPGERITLESEDWPHLVLTTHRVRLETKASNASRVVSIMLEEVASCAILRLSKPWLLALGVAASFYTFAMLGGGNSDVIAGFVVAVLFLGAYFLTRRQVLAIESAGGGIFVRIGTNESAREFIEAIESAKNDRYLLRP